MKLQKWQKAGLKMAFKLFLVGELLLPFITEKEIILKRVLIGAIIWLTVGVFYGYSYRKDFKEN